MWLVEFYHYTNANAAIWLADLLVHYQPDIRVQWLSVVYEMASFFRFSEVLEERFDANE